MRILCLIAILFSCLGGTVAASPLYQLANINGQTPINQFWYLNDTHKLSIEQIRQLDESQWQKSAANQTNALVSRPSGAWFSIELSNQLTQHQTVYLTLNRRIGLLSAYLFQQRELTLTPIVLHPYRDNTLAGRIDLKAKTKLRLFLYLKSQSKLNIPASIEPTDTFITDTTYRHIMYGIAIGMMACFAVIQLILFFGCGIKSYLLLFAYFITRTLLLACLLGWNLHFILPNETDLQGIDLPILISLGSIFLLLFTIEAFELKKLDRHLYKSIHYICLLLFTYVPVSFLFNELDNLIISMIIYICSTIILTIIGYFLLKNQTRLAKLLLTIGIIELLFIALISAGLSWYQLGLYEYKNLLFSLAFLTNGWLISYLISRQFYFENRDRIAAQQQALAHALQSTDANKALLIAQKGNQEDLEQRVQERTLELNIALQELEQANHELERKNMLDELSGLYNRRFYDQKIQAEFRRSKRNLAPLSLVLLDIDFFKKINDQYGHIAGDHCIAEIGKRIQHGLKRSTDVGCRYGGEEFCLILPDTDKLGAIELAELLRQDIAQQVIIFEDQQIQFTISCGVTTYQQQVELSPEQLFTLADKALYQAKQLGRNQVQIRLFETPQTPQELNHDP